MKKYFLIILMLACIYGVFPAFAQEANFGINDRVFVDGQILIVSGNAPSGNDVAIRIVDPDGTIKVFEQITVNDSGSFAYDLTWPKASVDYPFGIYTLEVIDLSENGMSENLEMHFTAKKWEEEIRNQLIASPLKQFKNGIPFDEIQCKSHLQKMLKRDGSPACVRSETKEKLEQRGWSDNFEHMTSSYMDIIVPTLEDFKNILSKPYNIDTIFSKFGEPHDDIGSGIHIYVYELNDLTEIWVGYTDGILYVKHVDSDGNELENLLVKKTESKTTHGDDFDIPETKLFLEKYPQAGIISDHMQYDVYKKHYTYTDSYTGDSVNLVLTKHVETQNMNSILSCHLDQNQNKTYGMMGSEKIIEYLQDHDCLSESNIGNLEPLTIRESFLELGFGDEGITVFITDMANHSAASMNLFAASQEWDAIPTSSLVGAHDRLPETSSDDRRGPGTMVSETVKAGTYIKQNDEKEFWYTIGGNEDETITIELKDHEFDRIVFVSDKNYDWIGKINEIAHSRK